MKHQILQKPDFGMLDVVFEQAGEQIVSEAGAMVGHDSAVQMETNMRGGFGADDAEDYFERSLPPSCRRASC